MKKKNKEYFENLAKKDFDFFIDEYHKIILFYSTMIFKCLLTFENYSEPSKNHLYNMRQISIDIEKFGKQLRERTILMEKKYKV